jgi:hypothetical protein
MRLRVERQNRLVRSIRGGLWARPILPRIYRRSDRRRGGALIHCLGQRPGAAVEVAIASVGGDDAVAAHGQSRGGARGHVCATQRHATATGDRRAIRCERHRSRRRSPGPAYCRREGHSLIHDRRIHGRSHRRRGRSFVIDCLGQRAGAAAEVAIASVGGDDAVAAHGSSQAAWRPPGYSVTGIQFPICAFYTC